MSLPKAADNAEPNTFLATSSYQHQKHLDLKALADSSSSSSSLWSKQNATASLSLSPISIIKNSKLEESDEDLFRVPDMETPPAPVSSAAVSGGIVSNTDQSQQQNAGFQGGKRRRGRNPVDKEYRRLKRLLRNRVSAQQARERKKVYVNDLESRARELQDKNASLEERISTLVNENAMLRKVLMNTRPKVDENNEPKDDRLLKG